VTVGVFRHIYLVNLIRIQAHVSVILGDGQSFCSLLWDILKVLQDLRDHHSSTGTYITIRLIMYPLAARTVDMDRPRVGQSKARRIADQLHKPDKDLHEK
jgi:hypothetical protein